MTTIESILEDPAATNWLKNALRAAIERDPVDAANDAATLSAVLSSRAALVCEESHTNTF